MLKIKLSRVWWAMLLAIALSYPVSAVAAEVLDVNAFSAPFVASWLGIWLFAAFGGLSAGLIKVEDVDNKLRHPAIAKFIIGLGFGMALTMAIDAMTSVPIGALPFFALMASCFSAPPCAGFMVYLSNQKRLDTVFDLGKDAATMRVFGKKSRDGDNDATD